MQNNKDNNTTTTTKATSTTKVTKTTMSTRSSNPNLLKTPQRRSRKIRGESKATPNKRRKLSSAKKSTKKSIFQNSSSDDNNTLAFSLLSAQGIASRPHVRASKLRCWKHCGMRAGYSKWRDMQLYMNIKMKKILLGRADLSVLHKSQKYDWNPKSLDELLENDPNPDADVRFFDSSKNKPPIISQFSLLRKPEIRKEKVQLVLVGTYQHICICLVNHEFKTVEFFDSRGYNSELKQIQTFFSDRFEGYTFKNANPDFDIQAEDEDSPQADEKARDIFCHTWIYLYSYRRLLLKQSSLEILRSLVLLNATERLSEIKRFQEWLYSLSDDDMISLSTSSSLASARTFFEPKIPPKGRELTLCAASRFASKDSSSSTVVKKKKKKSLIKKGKISMGRRKKRRRR